MKLLIAFVFIVAGVFASPRQELKERNIVVPAGRLEGRIFKGQNASAWQFPYNAGLLMEGRKYDRECGGSVIGNQWILTAAHCIRGTIGGTVYLGGITFDTAKVVHTVPKSSIIVHPGYNRKTLEHDIGLIRIPFTGFNVHIQRVTLPSLSKSNPNLVNQQAIVTGWGRYIENSFKSSENLLWGSMTIISNADCSRAFENGVFSSNICTASTRGVNTCLGDSGGPVVWRPNDHRIQIGIISFGAGKCKLKMPAAHTRVSSYLEWIKEKTGIYY